MRFDFILPAAILASIGVIVFPLPAEALDLLLAANFAFAITLLIASVYLAEPEQFTSLPSIILLSTLFRLCLNIATARRLLGTGEAPELVTAFGSFVVGGNLVVGLAIFLVISVVQFLVIAKGAERVAEVAARFTLDAMPGKQMAIDADVRAGIISFEEARDRRFELQRDSKLYGALDGAMKFIKGDAIAGLIITAINIFGGMLIGVSQQRLSIAEAAQRYTIFTVGDGLIAQIPALLVAIAAGITVTRVGSDEETLLGKDIIRQLGREPQALGITAAVLVLLGLAPGMPTVSFLVIAGLFAAGASAAKPAPKQDDVQAEFRSKPHSILVKLSGSTIVKLRAEGKLHAEITQMRSRIFERWGLVLQAPGYDYERSLQEGELLINFQGADVALIQDFFPQEGALAFSLAAALEEFVEKRLEEFVTDLQTRNLLEAHRAGAEDLINSVVPQQLSITGLTWIIRELVRERVSVRELHLILQAVADYCLGLDQQSNQKLRLLQSGSQRKEILAAVRLALARTISKSISDGSWQLRAYVLEQKFEKMFCELYQANAPLLPSFVQSFRSTLHRAVEEEKEAVILASSRARAILAAMLQGVEGVRAVAFEELSPEIQLTVIRSIPALMEKESEKREAA